MDESRFMRITSFKERQIHFFSVNAATVDLRIKDMSNTTTANVDGVDARSNRIFASRCASVCRYDMYTGIRFAAPILNTPSSQKNRLSISTPEYSKPRV